MPLDRICVHIPGDRTIEFSVAADTGFPEDFCNLPLKDRKIYTIMEIYEGVASAA